MRFESPRLDLWTLQNRFDDRLKVPAARRRFFHANSRRGDAAADKYTIKLLDVGVFGDGPYPYITTLQP